MRIEPAPLVKAIGLIRKVMIDPSVCDGKEGAGREGVKELLELCEVNEEEEEVGTDALAQGPCKRAGERRYFKIGSVIRCLTVACAPSVNRSKRMRA